MIQISDIQKYEVINIISHTVTVVVLLIIHSWILCDSSYNQNIQEDKFHSSSKQFSQRKIQKFTWNESVKEGIYKGTIRSAASSEILHRDMINWFKYCCSYIEQLYICSLEKEFVVSFQQNFNTIKKVFFFLHLKNTWHYYWTDWFFWNGKWMLFRTKRKFSKISHFNARV